MLVGFIRPTKSVGAEKFGQIAALHQDMSTVFRLQDGKVFGFCILGDTLGFDNSWLMGDVDV